MPARYLTLSSREPAGGLHEELRESGLGLGGRGQEALLPGQPQAGEQAPGGQGQGSSRGGAGLQMETVTSENWNAAWEIPELIHHPEAPWQQGPGSWDPQEEPVHTPPNPHTHTHTREHKHRYTRAYQCTHVCTHAHACTCKHSTPPTLTHMHTDVHVYKTCTHRCTRVQHTCAQMYTVPHTCAHRCTCTTHTYTHRDAHTHRCAHIHTALPSL